MKVLDDILRDVENRYRSGSILKRELDRKGKERTLSAIKFPRTDSKTSGFDKSLVFQARFEDRPLRDFGNFGVMNEVDALNPTLSYYRAHDEYFYDPNINPLGVRDRKTGKIKRLTRSEKATFQDKFQALANKKGVGKLDLSPGTIGPTSKDFGKYVEKEKKIKDLADSMIAFEKFSSKPAEKRAVRTLFKTTAGKLLKGLPFAGAVIELVENGAGSGAGELILDSLGFVGDVIRPEKIVTQEEEDREIREWRREHE